MLLASSWRRLLPTALLLLLLAPPTASAQDDDDDDGRTLYWRELAVQANLDADGRLHVRERQAMVFDGAWNGGEREFDLRLGQELRLGELVRIDPTTGARIPLVAGDLEEVDEFDWTGRETLRWRSRAESDPPFRAREMVYELAYTVWPVLVETEDGEYLLRHDFAFPDRDGVIERFTVDLTLDSAWTAPAGRRIRESAAGLGPGRGYALVLPLRRVTADAPEAVVPDGAPSWVRMLVAVGALLVPLLVFVGLRHRARELDRVAPVTPPGAIDEEWLRTHIFTYPAEVVGTAWDRSVGEPEVAALLARLVAEGKLTSRVDTDGADPLLVLRRVAPLSAFEPHERDLLDALFFDGREETDTAAIREHYEKKGFDPASLIRDALTAHLKALPGEGRIRRRWLAPAAVVVAGVVVAIAFPGPPGTTLLAVLGAILAMSAGMIALGFAALLSMRVTHRTGPEVGVLLPLTLLAVLLAVLASGTLVSAGALIFYRPPAALLLGHLLVLAGLGMLAIAVSGPTERVERLAFRRRLVSARVFFESELARREPRLQDAWFPYLLAFGLGPQVDQWFRAFGGRDATATATAATVVAAGSGTSSGHGGGGWSGGGPQFGGGSWGGGGAGGAWSVAAAGMAAGVAAPSSGGGGSVSGGGGGGGW